MNPHRSVVYTVNNHIKQHVNVLAKIVSPEISISQSELVLKPTLGVPQTYGNFNCRPLFTNKSTSSMLLIDPISLRLAV